MIGHNKSRLRRPLFRTQPEGSSGRRREYSNSNRVLPDKGESQMSSVLERLTQLNRENLESSRKITLAAYESFDQWVKAQLEVNQELIESSAANLKALWGQGEPVKFTTKVPAAYDRCWQKSFEVTRDCLEAATRTQNALTKLVAEQTSDVTEAIGEFTEHLASKAFAAPETMSARAKEKPRQAA